MLLSRALDAWSHSRDYFSRAYLAPVSLAMYWFVFSALGTHPLFPVLDFYFLLKEYLTNLSNIIVLVDLLRQKLNAFLSFYQLQNGTVEIHDPELEEQLSLSTADLRFADYLIHHVNEYTEKGEQEAGWFSAVKKKIFGHRTLFASTSNPGLSLFSSLVIAY